MKMNKTNGNKKNKPFYNTEIPSDWEVKRLEGITEKIGDGLHGTPEYVSSSEYFFINGNNLKEGVIQINGETKCVSEEEYKRHKKDLKQKSVLLSINGTIGSVAFFRNEKIVLGKSVAYINCKDENVDYLYYFLQSQSVVKFFEGELTGSTIRNLSLKSIRGIPITLPSLPEQNAIANLLTTWDTAITKHNQLIAQKQLRKKWLMQNLLTGKKRLKGFGGEWKEVKLGNIIEICSSKRVLQQDWKSEGIPFFRTREVISLSNGEEFRTPIYISENLFEELKRKYGIPKKGDILASGVGTIGETYVVKNNDKFYFKDGNVLWFKMNNNIDSSFLNQQFQTKFIRKQLFDNASITTVATFTIDGARKTKIKLPVKEEQTAIAQVLQTADKEIQLLQNKLEKLKEQKKGLMQQFLTGKKRLKY